MERQTREEPRPADPKRARRKRKQENQLDEALKETFPSSDPVSISLPPKEKEWTEEELTEAEGGRRGIERSQAAKRRYAALNSTASPV